MKAKSDVVREIGKDFLIRFDIIPEDFLKEDYKSDERLPLIPIEILVEPFKGLVVQIIDVKFGDDEPDEDDTVGLNINYTVMEEFSPEIEGGIKGLNNNPEFVTILGDIVISLVMQSIDEMELEENESRENNINKSDT